jgi:hypothetical protein
MFPMFSHCPHASTTAIAALIARSILLTYVWRHQKARSTMPDEIVSFGFEDFWPQASKEYADVFHVVARLIAVVNEALDAAEKKPRELLDISAKRGLICHRTRPYDWFCHE